MREEWLMPGAVVPIDAETTAALVAEIKRLVGVVGDLALRQALAQPEQEPVAWMDDNGFSQPLKEPPYYIPLYTAPPKREWVGLTDEERFKISRDTRPYVADTMRAHEEELKRRNT